jgi:hypothetical protein
MNWPSIPPEVIERDYKPVQEYLNLPENESKKIYEIVPHKHYILLHKKGGKAIKIIHAQNVIVLMLNG